MCSNSGSISSARLTSTRLNCFGIIEKARTSARKAAKADQPVIRMFESCPVTGKVRVCPLGAIAVSDALARCRQIPTDLITDRIHARTNSISESNLPPHQCLTTLNPNLCHRETLAQVLSTGLASVHQRPEG